METSERPQRSLARKLSEIMGEVKRIAKNGRNDHFGYNFATEADIAEAVRDEMAKRHLIMFPSVKKTEWEKVARRNGETKLCTLTVEFTIEDGDSGETRTMEILGQGEDSLDKATYKAMTGAEKYALMKLFLIPTGDDPERSETRRQPQQQSPQGQRAAPPQASARTARAPAPAQPAKPAPPPSEQPPTPAKPTPWERVRELGALYGKTPEQTASFAKSVLGKASVGEGDVVKVQEALGALGKPIVGGA